MSLTSDLGDPSSSASEFLEKLHPRIDLAADLFDRHVAGAHRTLPPRGDGDPDWATVGRAFGYRAGFSLDVVPPFPALLGAYNASQRLHARHAPGVVLDAGSAPFWRLHGKRQLKAPGLLRRLGDGRWLLMGDYEHIAAPDEVELSGDIVAATTNLCERLASFLQLQDIRRTRPTFGVEMRLARACWVLSLLEAAYRSPHSGALDQLIESRARTGDDLLELAEEDERNVRDIVNLSMLFTEVGLPRLRSLADGPGTVNPLFAFNYADGDLMIGDCLIDIKAVARNVFVRDWVLQLLGYALLDTQDIYGIRQVALYFARHGVAISIPLDQLVPTSCEQGALRREVCFAFTSLVLPGRANPIGGHIGQPERLRLRELP